MLSTRKVHPSSRPTRCLLRLNTRIKHTDPIMAGLHHLDELPIVPTTNRTVPNVDGKFPRQRIRAPRALVLLPLDQHHALEASIRPLPAETLKPETAPLSRRQPRPRG